MPKSAFPFLFLRFMYVGAQKLYRTLNRILGIVPRLLVVAVVELLAEPAYVILKLVKVSLLDRLYLLRKLRDLLLGKLTLTVLQKLLIVRQAEIWLSVEFFGKIGIGIPKKHRGLNHMLEVKGNSVANVAGIFKLADAFNRFSTRTAAKSSVTKLFFEKVKMTLKGQSHTEAVLSDEHHIVVSAAKAGLIGFDPDIGLHHRCAKDQLKLIVFKLIIEGTEGATAAFVSG